MRSLSSPDLVDEALKTLKGKAKVKRAMWSRRAQEYEQKINSGDLIAIAEVVRDLTSELPLDGVVDDKVQIRLDKETIQLDFDNITRARLVNYNGEH